MPAGQPFTQLCRAMAQANPTARVDLHMHTTCSDGLYTPAQIVDLARRSGLPAISITDHDTFAAIPIARGIAGAALEIIPGVEISTVHEGRELHLLAYFVRLDCEPLNLALDRICRQRRERFFAMAERLRGLGVALDDAALNAAATDHSLGRRHLAHLLVKERKTASVRQAFQRYLGDEGKVALPKARLETATAIGLVREAGGVASWAHPNADCTWDALRGLYNSGMRALEVDWPTARPNRVKQLREWAGLLGMAVTGGSDCHGPDDARRTIGACGVTMEELARLRRIALGCDR